MLLNRNYLKVAINHLGNRTPDVAGMVVWYMKILNKDISLRDFVPPLILRLIRSIRKVPNYFDSLSMSMCNPKIVGSYSQYGEDLLIDGLINCKRKGVYLDIGANDPFVLSNTLRFYERGWSGVNIEPNTEIFEKLRKFRPRDINLNIGVGLQRGQRMFYIMSSNTLSTFKKRAALINAEVHNERVISTKKVQVCALRDIFETYIGDKRVDFMSLDVEGSELEILMCNNWLKYRPYLLIIETNFNGTEILNFLKKVDYEMVYTNATNSIFVDKKSIKELTTR